jgi:hypothetical protein
MSEQTAAPAPGTLSGINLTGEVPDADLPADDERTQEVPPPSDETPETPEPQEAEAPVEEPVDPDAPHEAPEVPQEQPDAPEEVAAGAAPDAKKGAPARQYVVLRQEHFEDGTAYLTKVHTVESRNAQNAMRQAARELRESGAGDDLTLVVIPGSMFRPTQVKPKTREVESWDMQRVAE